VFPAVACKTMDLLQPLGPHLHRSESRVCERVGAENQNLEQSLTVGLSVPSMMSRKYVNKVGRSFSGWNQRLPSIRRDGWND
jgi:hypothetical protein